MKQERTKTSSSLEYGRISRFLHWFMAVWIIGLLTMGFYMVNLPAGPLRSETLYPLHKISGFFFLFFVIFRLVWRLTHPAPPLPQLHPIHRFFARASVPVLYAVMFIMPLSGIVMSHASGHAIAFGRFGTLPALLPANPQLAHWASEIHHTVPYAILFIITLHVLAALYHHFGLRDTALRRMIKGGA